MIVKILNLLHRAHLHKVLCWISMIGYFIKTFRYVPVIFRKKFGCYEIRNEGITYLSEGAGWAYSHNYLLKMLKEGYCHYHLPSEGQTVIDIGAGLGEETLVFAKLVGSRGKVFAIEAHPRIFGALEYACLQNNFHWVKPIHAAIYSSDHTVVEIEDREESYLGNTITLSPGRGAFKVRGKTLDSIVDEFDIKVIDFIKVNIEGAEQYLIEGMEKSSSIVKKLCISCHDFRENYLGHGRFYLTKIKVKSYLESKGYEVKQLSTGNPMIDDYLYAFARH